MRKSIVSLAGICGTLLLINNLAADAAGSAPDSSAQNPQTEVSSDKATPESQVAPQTTTQTESLETQQKEVEQSATQPTAVPTPEKQTVSSVPEKQDTAVKEQSNENQPKIVYVYKEPPSAEDNKEKQAEEYTSEINGNPLLCMARGVTNIGTCWLELPRCIIYDTKMIPVAGTIFGIPEGAGYMVVRALVGVADIICIGFDGGALYGKYLPNFIWEANWAPSGSKPSN